MTERTVDSETPARKHPEIHPVQKPLEREQGLVGSLITERAYEVYCHVYGEQPALMDLGRNCGGGFGVGELIAFLYARSFPKSEWRARVDEAFEGMQLR